MIERLGDFLQHNLVFFLAIILVPLKIVIIRFCRDKEGEAAAILSIPEDLCYVALGLIVSDLLTPAGALHRYFQGSKHTATNIAIVITINVGVAIAVHTLAQLTQSAYRRWRGTEALVDEPHQSEFAFAASGDDAVDHLIAHHFITLAMLYSLQLAIVVVWLHWLAKVIANVPN